MEKNLLFEDIYEPIKFQMKNIKGEIFDCQTQFRTLEDNIALEKLGKMELDENGNIKNGTSLNEQTIEMMVKLCGQTIEFWKQFSDWAVLQIIQKITELEKDRFKKKIVEK